MLYRALRPLLYAMPAERAHHLAFGALRATASTPAGRTALRAALGAPKDPALAIETFGLRFEHPVGLAAGFDKDAIGYRALGAAGFAFVEVGTLTHQAQTGNPQPRLFRLEQDRALINRMGFNNGGAAAAARRLSSRRGGIVGVNIGKTKVVPEADAIEDYVASTRLLARHADYFVVNVSSPNTPGLRNLQAVERLEPLLVAVREAAEESHPGLPLLVKIAPDLADDDVDAVAQLVHALALDGVIATNTTIGRPVRHTSPSEIAEIGAGGLSGEPLKERSLEVLRRLRRGVSKDTTLVAVGGIANADDAWARILAGASLIQIYTAYIYGGPRLPARIAQGLSERLRVGGYTHLSDAVGAGEHGLSDASGERVVARRRESQ